MLIYFENQAVTFVHTETKILEKFKASRLSLLLTLYQRENEGPDIPPGQSQIQGS